MTGFPTKLVLCLLIPAAAQPAEALSELLSRIDQAAASFRGATAGIRKVSYTAVIKDKTEEQGRVALKRVKRGDTRLRVNFTGADERAWAFAGRKAELFIPRINTVQEYDLGKQGRLLDQFLLLGFGSSSAELRKGYELKLAGEEMVNGRRTTRLELTPRSAEVQQHLEKVEIWFPADSGYPVQQKFHQGSGDYVQVTYSDLKLEPSLPDSAVQLDLPKNVKREYPQK